MADQYLLRRKSGDLWKHRASARKTNFSGARKMEGVETDIEEEAEHLGSAGHGGHALRDPDRPASLGKRRPDRVPQLRQGDGWVLGQICYAMSNDQPPTPIRTRLLLMRV